MVGVGGHWRWQGPNEVKLESKMTRVEYLANEQNDLQEAVEEEIFFLFGIY